MESLKLGTQTASVTNWLMSGSAQPTPEVGMGATVLMWTDRKAGTIVSLEYFKGGAKKGQIKSFTVREDVATRTDANGMSECQSYTYSPSPEGEGCEWTFKMTKAGWREGNARGTAVGLGYRQTYHDFSF